MIATMGVNPQLLDTTSANTVGPQSCIVKQLKKISQAETQISDMIGRHIKKRGADRFSGSSFVVTKRVHREQIMHEKIMEKEKD
jgi:hypothetical protein